jgi:hypothetical protein
VSDFRALENPAGPDAAAALARKVEGKGALMPSSGGFLAHVAVGGPWRTLITLMNPGISATGKAVLKFYSSTGAPLTVTLADGRKSVTSSAFEITLPPRNSLFLETINLPAAVQTGYAQLDVSSGNIAGYGVFRAVVAGLPNLEAVVPLEWGITDQAMIAYDNTRGFVTSVAIANPWGFFPSELVADVYDEDGLLLATYRRVLPGQSQVAFETYREWPATAGRRGVVRLSQIGGLGYAALALLFNPTGSVTTAPVPDVR